MSSQLLLGLPVFWFTGAASVLWFLLELATPSARKSILKSSYRDVANSAAKFRLLSAFKSIAMVAALSGVAVIGLFVAATLWLQASGDSEKNLEALVQLRQGLSEILDTTSFASGSMWIVALLLIALIWAFASRSTSRKRWNAAVQQRRSALDAEHDGLSDEAIVERLGGSDAENVVEIRARLEKIHQQNLSREQSSIATPVVLLGKEQQPHSLADLEALRAYADGELERLSKTSAEPKSEDAAAREAAIEHARTFSNSIATLIASVREQMTVVIERLDGSVSTVPLNSFDSVARPDDTQLRGALKAASVERAMRDHARLGASKARREPEMLGEWIGTVATSRAAVKASSTAGRIGSIGLLTALFLGLFGFTAHAAGTLLVDHSRSLEFTLIAGKNTAAVQQALTETPPPPAKPAEEEAPDLASEEATEAYVRAAFRAALVRDLTLTQLSPAQAAEARRAAFQLKAVQARQDVLSATARSAAPSLDPGVESVRFESSGARTQAASGQVAEVFDDALSRHTAQLKSNPSLWQSIRAEAVRPASASYAADSLFDAAFGRADLADPHAMRVYADRAASDFSSSVARNRAAAGASISTTQHVGGDVPLTLQERRTFTDFRAEAPEHLSAQNASYKSGMTEPGSLNRAGSSRTPRFDDFGRPVRAPTTAYADLFPTTADVAADVLSNALPNGEGPAMRGGRPTARAAAPPARSFGRIRFSGRVGGVVIGREPSSIVDAPDVVEMMAYVPGPDAITLKLTMRDGTTTTLGPYHPAIVHHALAYAADGRVVTSTLPATATAGTGDDTDLDIARLARQVVVHPAFEDTAFACAAIQVDRFVDRFSFVSGVGSSVKGIEQARMGVTYLGVLMAQMGERDAAARATFVADLMKDDRGLLTGIAAHVRACGTGADCFPLEDYKRFKFAFTGANELLTCLKDKKPTDCSQELGKLAPTGTYAVDSGVREMSYTVDKNFDFIRGPQSTGSTLWPLDFMVQAVPQSLDGRDVETDGNSDPWEFPSTAQMLRNAVANGLKTDPPSQQVLQHMQQFTVLQRLFRVAMNGDLGLDFPLHRLPQLQRATQKNVKIMRSERWNMTNELEDLMRTVIGLWVEDLQAMSAKEGTSKICKTAIDEALAEEVARPWPRSTGIWELVADFKTKCGGETPPKQLVDARALLREYGLIDEAIHYANRMQSGLPPSACPAL